LIRKKLEIVEYCNNLVSMITNYTRCTREIKYRVAMAIAGLNKKTTLFTSKLN
jgi:hypothetical protein